ncbi:MAG: hypothetical protein H6Q37_2416, partial [Chloroflexi bacterium]|nr:hypothetical protein [Chloroflexota bacterium]
KIDIIRSHTPFIRTDKIFMIKYIEYILSNELSPKLHLTAYTIDGASFYIG